MPIAVQTIVDRTAALLDAEGSERYLFNQDYKPAISGAVEVIVTALNEAFADNKLSPECLRELTKIKMWQTNQYSRFSYSEVDTGHPLWTVLAMYPKPVTNKGAAAAPTMDKSESKYRGDISFVKSNFDAKRLTFEEWSVNSKNIFMPGNTLLKGELQEYAYLDPADFTSTSYTGNPGKIEFTIRPDIPGELVALAYLKYPTNATLITDTLEFPQSLTEIIVELTANIISTKQSDGTNLYGVSREMSARLINLLK